MGTSFSGELEEGWEEEEKEEEEEEVVWGKEEGMMEKVGAKKRCKAGARDLKRRRE